ncbi:MAG: hypothetical protein GX589_06320 [Deltaproteobacteria bacterium]|nr:hypothetical protein [Deltaproteobacteria bacterium]
MAEVWRCGSAGSSGAACRWESSTLHVGGVFRHRVTAGSSAPRNGGVFRHRVTAEVTAGVSVGLRIGVRIGVRIGGAAWWYHFCAGVALSRSRPGGDIKSALVVGLFFGVG